MRSVPLPLLLRRCLRIALLCLAVLVGFAGTVAVLLVVLGWLPGAPSATLDGLPLAVLCGLIAWFFAALFHVRRGTSHVPIDAADGFPERLTAALESLGYEVVTDGPGRFVARPPFWSWLVGGRVEATLDGRRAHIVGPRMFVEMVRRRLRLEAHIRKARQSPRDSNARDGDLLIQRAEVELRFMSEKLAAVHEEVVRALEREGAKVVCELHLLVVSESGVREQTLDDLKGRLRPQRVRVTVHKDFARWEEPPSKADPAVTPSPESADPLRPLFAAPDPAASVPG